MKTVRDITKSLPGKKIKSEDIRRINIGSTTTSDSHVISNSFNNYFLLIVENRIHTGKSNSPIDYLYQAFTDHFQLLGIKIHILLKLKKLLNH